MNLRRATQIVLGLVVLVMAVLSAVVTATLVPEPGVIIDASSRSVLHVDPGSPSWRDGIRTGERVISVADAQVGWELSSTNGDLAHGTSTAGQVTALRSQIPWSLLALIPAAVAALLAYRRHPAAAVLLPVAFLFAAQPLFSSGAFVASLMAGVALFAGAGIAAIAFGRWRPVLVVPIIAGLALAGSWIVSTLAVPQAFDAVDAMRPPAVAGLSLVGFAVVADRDRIIEALTGPSGPAFVDLLYLGFALALLIAGALGIVPLFAAVIVTVLAVVAYPAWRHATVAAFDHLVSSHARRFASIRAVEDERGRLAREIHDTPLQELSGVIRRLEAVPGVEREADALRAVAGQLRDMATTLHPPVLQDLGLAAAIEDLRDQLVGEAADWRIRVEVDDLTNGRRPPAEVELAGFRVTQEAAANALLHSGGRCLVIRGSVAPEAIELAISDDGHGLREDDARAAKRSGHFGLDSMRERAAAVGGSTSLTSMSDGVCVQFQWEART